MLIDAFAALARRGSEVDLMIAGDGPDRAEIEQRIHRCGLDARVMLLGALAQERLWSLYRGAMLFVLPSRKAEGLPLTILEAMACGTPVIATNGGGTPEAVTDGVNGLLVERNDPTQFAAAIGKLLEDPKRGFGWGLLHLRVRRSMIGTQRRCVILKSMKRAHAVETRGAGGSDIG